jgi:cyclophilin family peptidyl-prolyl cis-trans isomerase
MLLLKSHQFEVFGKVVDGLDVVDKFESVGSQSGMTSAPVMIKDCGELE